jgi:hypothetical protein
MHTRREACEAAAAKQHVPMARSVHRRRGEARRSRGRGGQRRRSRHARADSARPRMAGWTRCMQELAEAVPGRKLTEAMARSWTAWRCHAHGGWATGSVLPGLLADAREKRC